MFSQLRHFRVKTKIRKKTVNFTVTLEAESKHTLLQIDSWKCPIMPLLVPAVAAHDIYNLTKQLRTVLLVFQVFFFLFNYNNTTLEI